MSRRLKFFSHLFPPPPPKWSFIRYTTSLPSLYHSKLKSPHILRIYVFICIFKYFTLYLFHTCGASVAMMVLGRGEEAGHQHITRTSRLVALSRGQNVWNIGSTNAYSLYIRLQSRSLLLYTTTIPLPRWLSGPTARKVSTTLSGKGMMVDEVKKWNECALKSMKKKRKPWELSKTE